MRAEAVLLLLLAAFCAVKVVTCAALDARPSLNEALASMMAQDAAVSVSLNSADYPSLKKDHVCFTAAKTCGYDLTYYRSQLTCCERDTPTRKDTLENLISTGANGPAVGHCNLHAASTPIPVSPIAYNSGSFLLTCELYGNAGTCGPHDCADLVLSAQGDVYTFPRTVVDGPLPQTLFGPGVGLIPCYDSSQRRTDVNGINNLLDNQMRNVTWPQLRIQRGPGSQNEATKGAGTAHGSTQLVNVADQVVSFTGPVSITSKTHQTKWRDGWFEYTYARITDRIPADKLEQEEVDLGAKYPIIDSDDFNKYKFQLYRDGSGHY